MKHSLFIAILSAIIVILGGAIFLFIQLHNQAKSKSIIEGGILYDQLDTGHFSYSLDDYRKIPIQLQEIFPDDSWYGVEYSQVYRSYFRWARGENPELRLPLIAKGECTLYLRMFSYAHPEQKEQQVRFLLNNHPIKTLTIKPTETEYSLLLPERYLKIGDNRLLLLYSYAISPSQVSQSKDTRSLSLAISGLSIKGGLLFCWSDSPGKAQKVIAGFVPLSFNIDLKAFKKAPFEFSYRYRFLSPDLYFPFPVRFSVTAHQGKRRVEIFRSEEAATQKGEGLWKQIRIDLSRYRGRLTELNFSASVPKSASLENKIKIPFPLYVEIGSPIILTTETKRDKGWLNVILISVDAMRADHLSCYWYTRETSPFMDRLAKNGILFQQAYSCAPWTTPSHTSMLSGLLPSRHGVFQRSKLSKKIPFLPQILKQKGYTTLGLTCGGFMSEDFGWDRGFDFFSSYRMDHSLRSQCAFSQAQTWISSNYTRPFFIFLHTYETHQQLVPPEPYRTMFYPEYRGPIVVQRQYIRAEMTENLSDADKKKIISLYDGEIRYTDDLIASLFNTLKKYNIDEQTLIIITADHGEEYWDSSDLAIVHGMLKYHIARVPLIMWNPKLFPHSRVVTEPVSLADLTPTILDIAKAKKALPKYSFDGISLLPYLVSKKALPERLVFCQDAQINKLTAIWREFKYDFSLLNQKGELYNIADDPLETQDLSTDLPEVVNIMRQGILKKPGAITNKILLKVSGKEQSAPFHIKIATNTYLVDIKSFNAEKEDRIIISPHRKEAEIISTAFQESDSFIIETLRMNELISFNIELNGKPIAASDIILAPWDDYPSKNRFSLLLSKFMLGRILTVKKAKEVIEEDSADKYIYISMIEGEDRYQAYPLEIDEKLMKELKSLGYLSDN